MAVSLNRAYDAVAQSYDGAYRDPRSLAEDLAIYGLLQSLGAHRGRVLDVGCGTGGFIDNMPVSHLNYFGVDPSAGMLDVARAKHPGYPFLLASGENLSTFFEPCSFDAVVALFGSCSYCDMRRFLPEAHFVLRPGGLLVAMPYALGRVGRRSYIAGQSLPPLASRAGLRRDLARSDFWLERPITSSGWLADSVPRFAPQAVFDAAQALELTLGGRVPGIDRRARHLVAVARRGDASPQDIAERAHGR